MEQLNEHPFFRDLIKTLNGSNYRISGIRTTSSPPFNDDAPVFQNSDDDDDDFAENLQRNGFRGFGFIGNNRNNRGKKSDNYEVVYDHNMNFNSVGGYDKIKKNFNNVLTFCPIIQNIQNITLEFQEDLFLKDHLVMVKLS